MLLTNGVCCREVDIFVDDFVCEILDNRFGLEQLFVMWFAVDDALTICYEDYFKNKYEATVHNLCRLKENFDSIFEQILRTLLLFFRCKGQNLFENFVEVPKELLMITK